ncbi:ribosomal L7Ae/L30e/S12e/Gadd45 family protein [Clostridium ganghwense]|uniref:Ribosomal L7Ae/L30e/S12e/Gadd45 family protein n=1 Tax=Clostridium ganghwense TaxID=312089 RepID=A0ABT4CR74_9CLOT|nr:ribosomal L7Ae/L30e/S12e/Gadd45 family protein [Clostridium ganghwense]MCY6371565.1 ribosomal L7Ae/L30e/S12e/Gadd45 family protein [Clostridium ganghwense]
MFSRLEGQKVIGLKQTLKHMKNGDGQLLYVAKDADIKLVNPLIELANEQSLKIVFIDTMKELGKVCGIDVGASVVLVLDK